MLLREKDVWIKEFVIDDIPNDWVFLTLIKALEVEGGEIWCMGNLTFCRWNNPFTGREEEDHN